MIIIFVIIIILIIINIIDNLSIFIIIIIIIVIIIFSSFNDNLLYDYDNEYSSHESKVNISCLFRYLSFSFFC